MLDLELNGAAAGRGVKRAVGELFDFQRLRRAKDIRTAPLLAASIFLDILNVFLLFLRLFGNVRS